MANSIQLNGVQVNVKTTDRGEYLSLTDLAKVVGDNTGKIIGNWLRAIATIEYLKEWELRYNAENFNVLGYEDIRLRTGTVQFTMSVKQWTEKTGAIGIISSPGRYGGTYAHNAIAIEFCAAISPAFKLGVYADYLELKENQARLWLKQYQFFLSRIEDNSLENNRLVQDLKRNLPK